MNEYTSGSYEGVLEILGIAILRDLPTTVVN